MSQCVKNWIKSAITVGKPQKNVKNEDLFFRIISTKIWTLPNIGSEKEKHFSNLINLKLFYQLAPVAKSLFFNFSTLMSIGLFQNCKQKAKLNSNSFLLLQKNYILLRNYKNKISLFETFLREISISGSMCVNISKATQLRPHFSANGTDKGLQ